MLTEEQKQRFSRQLLLEEIDEQDQMRLGEGRVMIAGLGGLGSISSYYLAAAGVGCLRVVDDDRVSLENLNRQILHQTEDIGRPKVESAAEKLKSLNPGCRIEAVQARIALENGRELAEGCDLIIDATDNRAARHALNRISIEKGIPFIYGGINGWDGMATTFVPGLTGCFACLFPFREPEKQTEAIGVLGPTGSSPRFRASRPS